MGDGWTMGGRYTGRQVIPVPFYVQARSAQAVMGAGFPSKEKPDIFFVNYEFSWMMYGYKVITAQSILA